jgi:hypothetical protein
MNFVSANHGTASSSLSDAFSWGDSIPRLCRMWSHVDMVDRFFRLPEAILHDLA